jgi:SAM-dependent methyltransferase
VSGAGGRAGPPQRIRWAVDRLAPATSDRLLEFGCGPGVAAGLVAERLDGGRLLAIDRSPTAIARAAARNAGHVEAGRLVLRHVALADLTTPGPPANGDRFDKAFAVDVNVLWTSTAERECEVLRAVLVPGGVVHLVYAVPGGRDRDVAGSVAANLARHRFATAVERGPAGSGLVCVTGHRPD